MHNLRKNGPQRRHVRLLIMAATAAALYPASLAVADNWNTVSGNWNTAGNWSPAAVPGAGDTVNIDFTDGVSRTITYDFPGSVTLGPLTVSLTGGSGASSAMLSMAANNLTAGNEVFGAAFTGSNGLGGVGTINQNGGVNTVAGSGNLDLGDIAGAQGFYNLSGTGNLAVGGIEYIGNAGTGSFAQTGGANSAAGSLRIGESAGAQGTYSLSGTGSLSSPSESVGYQGSGTFTQNGGSNSISVALYLGDNTAGAQGTYSLSGNSSTLSAPVEYIGNFGSGTFTQAGGTNTTSAVNIASSPGSSGVYNLSGGTLAANAININPGGAFSQTGGTITSGAALTMADGSITLSTTGQLTDVFASTTFATGSSVITAGPGTILQLGQFADAVTVGGVTTLNTTINRPITNFGATVQFNGPASGLTSPFEVISNSTLPTILASPMPLVVSGVGSVYNNTNYYSGYATYGTSDWAAVTASVSGTSFIVPATQINGFYVKASGVTPTFPTTNGYNGRTVYLFPTQTNATQGNRK